MIELRCRFKKAAEIDPASLAIVYRCPTCSRNAGKDVFHRWTFDQLTKLIESGQKKGVVPPQEA